MKNRITNNEKLQLLGLLTLAIQHQQLVILSEKAMCQILEVENPNGYAGCLSDAIYDGNLDIDSILKNMEIKVTK